MRRRNILKALPRRLFLGQGADPSRYLGLSLLSLAGQDEHPCDVNSSTNAQNGEESPGRQFVMS
jgi:hypothetical protein